LCRYAMGQLHRRARAKDVGEGSNVAREAESTEAHGGRARHHLGKVDGHKVRARPQWLSVPPIKTPFGSAANATSTPRAYGGRTPRS
jgi:hypothetical protein